jgi:hypothetical protein
MGRGRLLSRLFRDLICGWEFQKMAWVNYDGVERTWKLDLRTEKYEVVGRRKERNIKLVSRNSGTVSHPRTTSRERRVAQKQANLGTSVRLTEN